MDEVGRRQRLDFGQGDDAFCVVDAFQQPGHVVGEGAHCLKTFFVLTDIVGRHAVDAVPVLGGHDRHVRLHKVLQQTVVGGAGAAATGGDDSRRRLII